ncbi:MAG: hypothetical protein ABIE55_00540 [Candidatus Aenigmatarchaeota archaeon]
MERFFWITMLTVIAGLFQLLFYKSIELTIILFSINFMVFGLELARTTSKRGVLLKLESIERDLNDTVSNLISPQIAKIGGSKKEIIEWLNKF